MTYHEQASVRVPATADDVFAFIDDPVRLAGHMTKRSVLMGGSRMDVATDAMQGRALGSRTRLSGRFLGLALAVETEVIERMAPRTKAWRTVGEPHLLVIGRYSMSVIVEPAPDGCEATVTIDYELPTRRYGPVVEPLARLYAVWCVRQMTRDIAAAFPARATRGPVRS